MNNAQGICIYCGTYSGTYHDIQAISYDSSATYTRLDSASFDTVYRAATGSSSKAPSYTIKFTSLPAYGTLYRGNSTTSFTGTNGTKISTYNMSTLSFSNSSSGTNSISNVYYVPTTGTTMSDTVQYGVYSGSTLLYVGTINFVAQKHEITYYASSAGVQFSARDFFDASSSLLYSNYITFGTPSSGTLYKNGTAVTARDYFSVTEMSGSASLNNLTFVPKSGYTGVVEIPFYANSASGALASGVVYVHVAGNNFTDVDPNGWAASYIARLYATGVIKGTSTTTFSPNANMKYGEALKMILLAAGYPTQSETGGTHWASNYLTLAYQKGIVSTTSIDLNATVDRDTIATIAAKALGLASASTINAGIAKPADSTNGYVYALYNAGIVSGDSSSGTNYYYGTKNITRAEVTKIVCKIMDYKK